jgi:hypothetical protein
MFCPNCGANNSTEQKFCRACGLNLEQTALSLLEQIPSAESLKLLKRERNLEKFGNIVFTGFGLVLLTGIGAIIYLIITTVIMNGNVLGGVLIIAFLVFAALALTYVALNEDLKERKQKASPALKNELSEKLDTAKLLEDRPFEPVPTVTEGTTELLYNKTETKKLS